MRAAGWAAFVVCFAALAACGGAIAPTHGNGDGGSGDDALPTGSSGNGGSSGSVVGGSSATGPSSSGSSGGGSTSSGGSGTGSSGSGGETVDAAFACGNGAPPPMTDLAACNDCVESFCADAWCTCGGDSVVDDAGATEGCLGYVDCVLACLNGVPEAGIPPDEGGIPSCAMLCGESSAYSQQQQAEGQALLGCLAGSCASSATCGQ